MKQKVVTQAIIQRDEKILLLRRAGGRPSISGLYELPSGRVHIGQQPEDALAHALHIHMNVAPETIRLRDVMTFIDPDDRELQYVFIIFDVTLKPVDQTIRLSSDHDKYIWRLMRDLQREELTKSTQQSLGLQPVPYATGAGTTLYHKQDDKDTTGTFAIIYSDGGSRGNPGPSAAGFVIMSREGEVVAEGGAYLGVTTNNVAEYQAVYLGLEKAQELGYTHVDFRMDSQLVARQLNGEYKTKHSELLPIYKRILELVGQFESVTFTHVLREYNQLADGVVNKLLDQEEA